MTKEKYYKVTEAKLNGTPDGSCFAICRVHAATGRSSRKRYYRFDPKLTAADVDKLTDVLNQHVGTDNDDGRTVDDAVLEFCRSTGIHVEPATPRKK